jgi:hypothetical protein
MDTRNLRRTIEQEIDSYVYQHHPAAVGTPMPQEWVIQQLAAMRAALVDPAARLVEIRDTVAQMRGEAAPLMRECFLVADDREGYELYFFNVRGDAVGCFMAR